MLERTIMVIGIFGESCTGKSTLAEKISASFPCEVFTGKDYLRLAKNENIAKMMFRKKLTAAVNGENIIYVISEKEHLSLLPEGALRILVTADLELIKTRFAQRMHGNLLRLWQLCWKRSTAASTQHLMIFMLYLEKRIWMLWLRKSSQRCKL